ncbi:MAG TPA: LytTR family transcriptional regulator DNA-binding domain-containing protein [Bacteroidales bacterium]|nr:LytTR family transcriptional regulator DNA-binding domain-containing protein [Bacteroidales bacterium]
MSNKLDQFIFAIKAEIGLALKIGFGVFLFILFFRPFPLTVTDFNNQLLTVSGFGFIVFFSIVLVRVISNWLFKKRVNEDTIFPAYLNGLAVFIICSVAFAIYVYFAGDVKFTLITAFRIIIICLFPPVMLALNDSFRDLKNHNSFLVSEKKKVQQQIEKYEEDHLNRSIDFVSENANETLNLVVADIIYLKSADNYVEIAYLEAGNVRRKLIRNTLKNIELHIRQYSNFLRCHRTCIVNLHFIDKLHRDSTHHWLTIKGIDEGLPVSRQYLLSIREVL